MDEKHREQRIQELQEEIDRLEAGEELEGDPLLERLTVKKRPYTLSPAALAARIRNAQLSTGPVTAEGKAATSRNAWKHGLNARRRSLLFGKPCKSTCPKYPCSLVDDGDVAPGQDCLDKELFLDNLRALEDAATTGHLDGVKQMAAATLGGTVSVIQELQYAILENGVFMKSEKLDKDGKVIGYELKPNPALLPLGNLLKSAGLTLPDFMLTPREVDRGTTEKEAAKGLAEFFAGASSQLAKAKSQTKEK